MKNKARPQLRRTVAQELSPPSTVAAQPAQGTTSCGLPVRTNLKAGILTALLLQQAAAAGAVAGNGVVT